MLISEFNDMVDEMIVTLPRLLVDPTALDFLYCHGYP